MDDVVQRLKAYSGQDTRDFCTLGATGAMLWDAIDEIERLRATLTEVKEHVPTIYLNNVIDAALDPEYRKTFDSLYQQKSEMK